MLGTLPIMISSVMTGEWAMNVLVRMLHPFYAEQQLKPKFAMVQLILAAVKVQSFVANEILKAVHVEEPGYPVTPRVLMNCERGGGVIRSIVYGRLIRAHNFLFTAILQVIILTEMLLLAWWASRVYKFPNKEAINKNCILVS